MQPTNRAWQVNRDTVMRCAVLSLRGPCCYSSHRDAIRSLALVACRSVTPRPPMHHHRQHGACASAYFQRPRLRVVTCLSGNPRREYGSMEHMRMPLLGGFGCRRAARVAIFGYEWTPHDPCSQVWSRLLNANPPPLFLVSLSLSPLSPPSRSPFHPPFLLWPTPATNPGRCVSFVLYRCTGLFVLARLVPGAVSEQQRHFGLPRRGLFRLENGTKSHRGGFSAGVHHAGEGD